jgi:AbrB family looped-hinge helix DNA binding protein
MKYANNLTSKGQVTVPKDIRDALGLIAGAPVRFALDEDGNARILKADSLLEKERRKAAFLQRLHRAQALFHDSDTMPGTTTDAFMDIIREPLQPFEHTSCR